MTYTFVTLEVTERAYAEIRKKLVEAGYDHAILSERGEGPLNELIDMNGIALVQGEGNEDEARDS